MNLRADYEKETGKPVDKPLPGEAYKISFRDSYTIWLESKIETIYKELKELELML